MTSYEVMKRAIEFKKPARLPITCPSQGFEDIFIAPMVGTCNGKPDTGNVHGWHDEWGCYWERAEDVTMGQLKGSPLDTWDKLESLQIPDPDRDEKYVTVAPALENAGDKYVITGDGMTMFERMWALRGFENTLLDLYIEQDNVHQLLDIILEYRLGIVRNLKKRFFGKIHGLAIGDDWGSQQQTFISVDMFRQFFKPRYKKYFDAIHDAGLHVFFHSCGHINDFIQEFIDIGLDIIEPQQPTNLGIEEIGNRYRGKICFQTTVDIQKTLQWGTPEEIRTEARKLVENWMTPEGGLFITEYAGEAIGVPVERQKIMFEAFRDISNEMFDEKT